MAKAHLLEICCQSHGSVGRWWILEEDLSSSVYTLESKSRTWAPSLSLCVLVEGWAVFFVCYILPQWCTAPLQDIKPVRLTGHWPEHPKLWAKNQHFLLWSRVSQIICKRKLTLLFPLHRKTGDIGGCILRDVSRGLDKQCISGWGSHRSRGGRVLEWEGSRGSYRTRVLGFLAPLCWVTPSVTQTCA